MRTSVERLRTPDTGCVTTWCRPGRAGGERSRCGGRGEVRVTWLKQPMRGRFALPLPAVTNFGARLSKKNAWKYKFTQQETSWGEGNERRNVDNVYYSRYVWTMYVMINTHRHIDMVWLIISFVESSLIKSKVHCEIFFPYNLGPKIKLTNLFLMLERCSIRINVLIS